MWMHIGTKIGCAHCVEQFLIFGPRRIFSSEIDLHGMPRIHQSGTPQVVIGARISKSGDAMPKPGDFQGFTKPVNNTAKNLTIVIDTEVQ